jgi:cytochrome c oxidase subunit III
MTTDSLMTEVIHYRSPRLRGDNTAYLGMLIFLGSWAMMFAGLFFAYGVVRLHLSGGWPPQGVPRLPVSLPALNTAVLLASGLALQLGLWSIRNGKVHELSAALVVSLLLGCLFLGLQTYLWIKLYRGGLRPDGGPYPSVFYALTTFHGLHVVVGLVALAVLLFKSLQGVYSAPRHLQIKLWTMYWHFVDAVWILMFLTVFVT